MAGPKIGISVPKALKQGAHHEDPDVALALIALAHWTSGKIEAGLLAKARAAAPAGLALKSRHPSAEDSLEDIPAGCLDCHGLDSKKAPPFARLMHVVHLTGANNAYVANYKGDCTNCHKLDARTGEWSIPSGVEK